MIIKFKQEKADLYSFFEYHQWYAPDRKWFKLRLYLTLPLLTIFFLVHQTLEKDPEIQLSYFFNLGAILGILIIIYVIKLKGLVLANLRKNTDKQLLKSKNEDLLGDKEIEFKDGVILFRTSHSKGEMDWGAIEKFRIDSKYYYLYQNSIMAITIPKAAVENQEEFERMLKEKVSN